MRRRRTAPCYLSQGGHAIDSHENACDSHSNRARFGRLNAVIRSVLIWGCGVRFAVSTFWRAAGVRSDKSRPPSGGVGGGGAGAHGGRWAQAAALGPVGDEARPQQPVPQQPVPQPVGQPLGVAHVRLLARPLLDVGRVVVSQNRLLRTGIGAGWAGHGSAPGRGCSATAAGSNLPAMKRICAGGAENKRSRPARIDSWMRFRPRRRSAGRRASSSLSSGGAPTIGGW